MSLQGNSRMHLDGSAGESFLDLTAKAGMDLLTKIAKNKAMHKHWEAFEEDPSPPTKPTQIKASNEYDAKRSASKIASVEDTREASRDGFKRPKVEEVPTGTGAAPISTNPVSIGARPVLIGTRESDTEFSKVETNILEKHHRDFMEKFSRPRADRTLCNAKPLDEFEPMDWILIDFTSSLLNMWRMFDPRYASVIGIEYNSPSNTK